MLEEITEFNQRYLRLAQRLLSENGERGQVMLGVSDALAARLVAMTRVQLEQLAEGGELVCQFRADAMPGRA
ncbi:flagellar transcriptional regulator FlhD [Burkholderia oklahomensis]|nr:flagellar transcriptional regulator FlhD [Burkholderia oklahomensis]